MSITKTVHTPVLLNEAIDALQLRAGMTVVDATLGGGGYTERIAHSVGPKGKVIACDQDASAIVRFRKQAEESGIQTGNVLFINRNFSALADIVRAAGYDEVDAIVADIGLSSDQLADASRGFSFSADGPLDMRMDLTQSRTAAHILNTMSEGELIATLRTYGEERYASRIARAVIAARKKEPFTHTTQLRDLIMHSVPASYRHERRRHCATKTFQALRIAVNGELQHLETFLRSAIRVLSRGGRLAVVTFHSGEDRIVKNILRENARGCICPPRLPVCRCGHVSTLRIVTAKPITPSVEEIRVNPSARSAKLRIAEKT